MHASTYPIAGLAAVGALTLYAVWPSPPEQLTAAESIQRCELELSPIPPPPPPNWRAPELWQHAANGYIERAPAADQDVAALYGRIDHDRGALFAGERITLLSAHHVYKAGEPVRVIHVREVPVAGHEVFVMGPKAIHHEYVDGIDRAPGEPYAGYDGVVLQSPATDFNYAVTEYRFSAPGEHRIAWHDGAQVSNTLVITIQPPGC